jgi:hypothetical protein
LVRCGTSGCDMRPAFTAFLPTIVALILLPAIAFASPPDPSWIAGIYDGADGDDIVSLVYDTAVAHAAQRSHITPLPHLAKVALENIPCGVPRDCFTHGSRAPPVQGSVMVAPIFPSLPGCASTTSGTDPPVTRASLTTLCLPRWNEPRFHVHALIRLPLHERERPQLPVIALFSRFARRLSEPTGSLLASAAPAS